VRAALLLERGDAAAAHGALGQALTLFGPAVDRSEQARLAYLWAGLADRSAGQQQQDAARRALAALHALGPAGDDDPAWWRTTAYMHALVGELTPAAKAWRRAVAIDPGDQRSRRNLERIEQVMRARSAGD
jgi:tetratricopeptide (TPR) repeat protein